MLAKFPITRRLRDHRISTLPRAIVVSVFLIHAAPALADWPTHRGNSQRTGNTDGRSGPLTGKVLWIQKGTDDYLAPPVVDGELAFVSSLGAFNSSSLQALSTDAASGKRLKWRKGPPYLKIPTVSPPAVVAGLLVFGDGMHQTDGASLYGMRPDTGLPAWQFPISGSLVHVEGGPTIAAGRVYCGGGNAGVLCVDPSRLELDGKEIGAEAARELLQRHWQELVAKYEQEKKVDPDFAIPPNEDSLPRPRPKLVWQHGLGKLHVDAALAVDGEFVYASSAFLELEKSGDRSLCCLRATDGSLVWRQPLSHNPWAGVTVSGGTVIVGCSSIRLDPKEIGKGRGEVVAVRAADGGVLWRKDVPGGILSSVAVHDGLAVFTATDGRVRAWDVSSGQERWNTNTGSPFFAGAAVAGTRVYVADTQAVVHALSLADGKVVWSLDLTKPPYQVAGQVFGSPTVAGGRLYVATGSLESTGERGHSAVVCLGEN